MTWALADGAVVAGGRSLHVTMRPYIMRISTLVREMYEDKQSATFGTVINHAESKC